MLLTAVVTMTIAASEVALTIDPATPCLERPALVRALLLRKLGVNSSSEALQVTIAPAPGGLELVGRLGDRRFQRSVPTETSACSAVERIVANLIESWASSSPRRAPSSRADAGAPPPEVGREQVAWPITSPASERAPPDAGVVASAAAPGVTSPRRVEAPATAIDAGPAPAATSGTTARAASPSTIEADSRPGDASSSSDAPPRGTTSPPVASDPTSSPTALSSRVPSPPAADETSDSADAGAPEPENVLRADGAAPLALTADGGAPAFPFHLEVAVLGGGAIDGAGSAVGAGSALVRAALGRWGLLVDVGLESARTTHRDAVTVTASQQWLSGALGVAFTPLDALRLDVALGLRGWRTDASASGLDVTGADGPRLTWGGVISVGAAFRVTGPLFLTARGSASVRTVELSLNVAPYGSVLTLNPWNYGLQGGVLVSFE